MRCFPWPQSYNDMCRLFLRFIIIEQLGYCCDILTRQFSRDLADIPHRFSSICLP